MTSLKQLQANLDEAKLSLTSELNRQFPVGCRVYAEDGAGRRMHGVIAFNASVMSVGHLRIRSEKSGRVHDRFYKFVTLVDHNG